MAEQTPLITQIDSTTQNRQLPPTVDTRTGPSTPTGDAIRVDVDEPAE